MSSRRYRIAKDLHQFYFNERTIDVVRAYIDGTKKGHVEKHIADAAEDVMQPFVEYVVAERNKAKTKAWKDGYEEGWAARKWPTSEPPLLDLN